MDTHESYMPRRLRERTPPWPRRDDDPGPERRRHDRELEPFEDDALPELYPGALVMEDMVAIDDDTATLRVLARYTAARLLLLTVDGSLTGPPLRTERQVVLEHLALLPDYDWERRALERLAAACRDEPGRDLMEAITVSAEAAAKRSHLLGAFTLYRAGYHLATANGWWSEAAQVARGVAQLARLAEAAYSIRLWRRRAAVLERRAERDAAGPESMGGTGPVDGAALADGPDSMGGIDRTDGAALADGPDPLEGHPGLPDAGDRSA